MKITNAFLSIIFAKCISGMGLSTTATCNSYHTVVSGNTCWAIAQARGTTVTSLQGCNPGLDCQNLRIGQSLCVSCSGTTSSTSTSNTCSRSYSVVSGDTCWAIAQARGTTVTSLQGCNPGIDCQNLRIGQSLCVSCSGTTSGTSTSNTCSRSYSVVSGDTCWAIAQARGTTVTSLQGCNPGLDCQNLKVGQSLCVSCSSGSSTTYSSGSSGSTGSNNFGIDYSAFNRAVQAARGYDSATLSQYDAIMSLAAGYGGITSKREFAMFLAQIIHESDGLKATEEYACSNGNWGQYCNTYKRDGCDTSRSFHGRGYIQLTHCANYKAFSRDYFQDERLARFPEQVATDQKLAWASALFYWKNYVHNNVLNGEFGASTRAINGYLECGTGSDTPRQRFNNYVNICKSLGINETPNPAGC